MSDARPQFFEQDVCASLLVGIGLDQCIVETGGEVDIEVGADVFGFDERPRHCPESHDRCVVHSGSFA